MTDVIKIANCSGFYGDKLSAAKEMVEGGPIDVLTGDYLAELTMAILYGQKMKRNTGYVATFLKQVKQVLQPCIEKNIRIVSNAGGLNPSAMAEAVKEIANELNLDVKVAYIDGDDLAPRMQELQAEGETFSNMDSGANLADNKNHLLTANAYLGAWGIKEALDQGADVVICPRVTDAAVVIGPAAWKFNWQRTDYDALAGALAAGHVIECGQQATGGNYAFFQEVPSFDNPGYPIAEIEANGDFTITKHAGTGGLVSVGTVKSQLLYEIGDPAYKNPDVIGHFDTLRIDFATSVIDLGAIAGNSIADFLGTCESDPDCTGRFFCRSADTLKNEAGRCLAPGPRRPLGAGGGGPWLRRGAGRPPAGGCGGVRGRPGDPASS